MYIYIYILVIHQLGTMGWSSNSSPKITWIHRPVALLSCPGLKVFTSPESSAPSTKMDAADGGTVAPVAIRRKLRGHVTWGYQMLSNVINICIYIYINMVPAGKYTKNYGTSAFLMDKSTDFLWPCVHFNIINMVHDVKLIFRIHRKLIVLFQIHKNLLWIWYYGTWFKILRIENAGIWEFLFRSNSQLGKKRISLVGTQRTKRTEVGIQHIYI